MPAGIRWERIPFLLVAMLCMVLALLAGVLRSGWTLTVVRLDPGLHGSLMVAGFLGTLIGLERAVGLGQRWVYAAPLLTGLGGIFLLAGQKDLAPSFFGVGGFAMVGAALLTHRIQPALHTAVMGAGALCWLAGNVLWSLGRPLPQVVAWWGGFLLLTIAGERLEMSRMRAPSRGAVGVFGGFCTLFVLGLMIGGGSGARLAGVAAAGLSVWLLRYDLAGRTVRSTGLTRYVAVCVLSGYFWLFSYGVLALVWGAPTVGLKYDALMHCLFVGYVFTMIFGHAPIVLPAVTGIKIPYGSALYGPLTLLHLSLLIRVGSDLAQHAGGRRWGAMLNAFSIVLFFLTVLLLKLQGTPQVLPDPHGRNSGVPPEKHGNEPRTAEEKETCRQPTIPQ